MDPDGCAIDGNGDLYGLGVRIGVYCQWVSSWTRMLVDEESIEDVHGVNAIFVFAVIIATILAQVHRDVKPIELYIMLQISLGFFITVLSTIGVRNHFLRPKRVKLIWHHYQKVVEKRRQSAELGEKIWSRHRFKQIFKEEREGNNVVKAFYQSLFRMGREYLEDAAARQYLSNPTFEVPIGYLTPFKPRNISWVGVVWRTAILGVVAGFNVYFWFYIANQPSADDGCGAPFLFLFSMQRINKPVLVLSQVVAIIVVIVVLPLCLFLVSAAAFLVTLLSFCALRDVVYLVIPSSMRLTKSLRTKLLPFLERVEYYLRVGEFILKRTPSFRVFVSVIWLFILSVQLLSFFTKLSDPQSVSIHDSVRAAISLFTPKQYDDRGEADSPILAECETYEEHQLGNSICFYLSVTWNVMVFLSILWFILSIELTLGWNHVQDINEIKTTGQLIPFIIGCVSTCQVLKQVALIGLRKMFPDWASYELEAAYTARGGVKFHINHSPRDDKGISTGSETRMATGIAFRDVGFVESGQKP
ncbi:hypothetical protein GQ607_005808 [Colletotrichum asianum]|uniref:Uncharacterized protein n=1 Tax=Colletotrichum asianum TaxID=702518 RepID=A0A8H3WH87_9PEZI|nr:hypothetical protein GQ607_005808 [Colletotrichum asianum]